MTILSEKTGKTYATVAECVEDEKKFDEAKKAEAERKNKLNESRKERAKEVEEAYKAKMEADKLYRTKLNKFIDDYGSFHMTIDTEIEDESSIFDYIFNNLF